MLDILIEHQTHIPTDFLLKADSLPSVWCSGCGIGTAVNVLTLALDKSEIPPDDICLLSTGIGCTGKIDHVLNVHSYEVLGESVIDHAVRLKQKNPRVKMILFLDDADFLVTGVEPFVQAGVKGTELLIVYFNNFIYRIFMEHKALRSPIYSGPASEGRFQSPFNIPSLARFCGAGTIARWTPHHPNRLLESLMHVFRHPDYSVVELISPCLMYFPNVDGCGQRIDRKRLYMEETMIRNNAPAEELDIGAQDRIVIGEFLLSQA